MIAGSLHANDPPNMSMFSKAHGTTSHQRRSDQGIAEALARVATQLSEVLSPIITSGQSSTENVTSDVANLTVSAGIYMHTKWKKKQSAAKC